MQFSVISVASGSIDHSIIACALRHLSLGSVFIPSLPAFSTGFREVLLNSHFKIHLTTGGIHGDESRPN